MFYFYLIYDILNIENHLLVEYEQGNIKKNSLRRSARKARAG